MNIEIKLNFNESPSISIVRDSGLVQVAERTTSTKDRSLSFHVFNGDFTYVLKGLVDYLDNITSIDISSNGKLALSYPAEKLQFVDYEVAVGNLDATNPNRVRNEEGLTEHLTFNIIDKTSNPETTDVEGEETSKEV